MSKQSLGNLSPVAVTWMSIGLNLLLVTAKIVVGLVSRSQTLVADGLHSISDTVTDVAVLAGLRVSGQPADSSHHYGHRRFSTLVAMFVGATLGVAAVWIGVQAISSLHALLHGHPLEPLDAGTALGVAIASVLPKEIMCRITQRVGRRVRDSSLIANAWHDRMDAMVSTAAAASLAGVVIGGPSWRFLDPLMAEVLAAFLLVVAYRIIARAAAELVDRAPEQERLRRIEHAVTSTPGVQSYHAFRARQLGGTMEMDIHVQVDPSLTVAQGHDIASAVRASVQRVDPTVVAVIVHIEPAK